MGFFEDAPASGTSFTACLDVISHNWGVVFQAHKEYENDLLDRIERKTQEVKSLRDGVSNSKPKIRKGERKVQLIQIPLAFQRDVRTRSDQGHPHQRVHPRLHRHGHHVPAARLCRDAVRHQHVQLRHAGPDHVIRHHGRCRLLSHVPRCLGTPLRRPAAAKKGSYGEMLAELGAWARPSMDTARRVFRAWYGSEETEGHSQKHDAEVTIHEELPLKVERANTNESWNKEKTPEKRKTRWKVIPGWVTRRGRGREADVVNGIELA